MNTLQLQPSKCYDLSMDLQVNVIEHIIVEDVVGVLRHFVQIVVKVARVLAEDILHWRKTVKDVPANGPPTLGVSVSDDSNTKEALG